MKRFFVFLSFLLVAPTLFAATEIRDTEIESVVYEIVRPLADAAEMNAERTKVHLLADNQFNAFVMGGTDIFINTGLLIKIESPDELAAVLAHEIGHTQLGHMVQMAAKMRAEAARSLVMQMLGVGMMVMNPEAGIGMMAGASGMAAQSMLAFTRDEERAADDYAVKLLDKAGIDLNALVSVFRKMQSSAESAVNPNNIGHPLTEERIRNIKLQIEGKKFAAKDVKKLKMVQAKLIGYIDSVDRVMTLFPTSDTSDPALYARAIARMRGGNLELAKTGTLTLISRDKKNPYFYELLGDLEFQFGHYDDSVDAYEKALELTGGGPQIQLALALVLSERRQPDDMRRAADLCRRALLVEPMPLAWLVLAKSDEKKSDYYLAEYNYLNRDIKKAKSLAKSAMKKLDKDSPEYLKAKDIAEMR